MVQNSNTVGPVLMSWLLGALILPVAAPLNAQSVRIVPVNIYGDGNPLNGIEDSREPVKNGGGEGGNAYSPLMNAGTITCDRRFRGTAMIADTREYAPDLGGVVLVSAAHVLYDLNKNRLFRRCQFNFMRWEKNAAYRSKIDLKNIRLGDFDPQQSTGEFEFGEGDWVFLYLRKPWKNYNPEQGLQLRVFTFAQAESYRQSGGEFRLLAFDTTKGVISESGNCKVVESEDGDLGGGTWRGQLLDDCDSTDGASGGGIVAVLNQQRFLIGIRNGSHWSEQVYPADSYPLGPPEGSVWDRRLNTNFGRAIDIHLLRELDVFVQGLKR